MVVANKVSRSKIAKKLLKREKLNFDDYIKKNKIKKKKRSKKINKNPIRGLKKSKKQKKLILEGGVGIFSRGKSTDFRTARTGSRSSSSTGSGSSSSTDKKSGSSIYQKTGLDAVGKRLRTVFAGRLKRRLFKIILAENKIFKKGIVLKKNLNKLEDKITGKFGNLSGFLKADIFGDSTGNIKNLKDIRKYTSVIANIRENKYFNFTAKCSGTNLAKFRSNFKDLKNFARSIKKKFSTTVGISFKSTISDFKKYGNRHNRFLMCRIYAIRKKELEYNYQYYNLIGNIKKFLKQQKINEFIGNNTLKIDDTIFENTRVNNFPIFIYDKNTLNKIRTSESRLQSLINDYLSKNDKNSSPSLNDGKKINYKIKREQRNKIKQAINKIDKKDKYFALILFIIVEFYNESKLIRTSLDKLVNNYAFPSYDGLNFCLTKLRKTLKYGEFYREYINKLNNIETKVNYLCNSLSNKVEVLFSSTVLDNKENYEKLIYYKTALNKINEIEMYMVEKKTYFDQTEINNIVSKLNEICNTYNDNQLRNELASIQYQSNRETSSQLSNHLFKSLSRYLTNKIKLLDGTLEKTKDGKQFSITDLSDRKQGIINLSKKNQVGGDIKKIVQTPLDRSLSNIKINKISKEILEELYSDYMFLLNNPLYLISKDGFENFRKRATNELGSTTVSGLKLFTLGIGLKMEDSKKQLQKRKKTKGAIFINRMYSNLLMKVLDFGVLNINLNDTDGQIPLNFPNGTALNSLPGFIRNNIFKNFDSKNPNFSDFSKISNIYKKRVNPSQIVQFSNPTAINEKFSVPYIPASMASISYLTRREIISILGLTKSTDIKYELDNDMGKQIDIILKDKYNTFPMDSIRQMYLMNIVKPLQYRMMDLLKNDKSFGDGYLKATARELKDSARINDQKYLINVIDNNVLVRLNNNLYRNDFDSDVLNQWAIQPTENKKNYYNTFKDIYNNQNNIESETEHPLTKFKKIYENITDFMDRINNYISAPNSLPAEFKNIDDNIDKYLNELQKLAKNFDITKQKIIRNSIDKGIFSTKININNDENEKYYENGIQALKIINSFNECNILLNEDNKPTILNNELELIYFIYKYFQKELKISIIDNDSNLFKDNLQKNKPLNELVTKFKFVERYNILKKRGFQFKNIFSSLDYIYSLTTEKPEKLTGSESIPESKLDTINEYVKNEINKKNEPTSCIDDYYKLDYITQYSFYLALIVLINKKKNNKNENNKNENNENENNKNENNENENNKNSYLFKDFEGFKKYIKKNKDYSLKDLIQPKDYYFLIKNIDLRFFRRIPGEFSKFILKLIDISLLTIPSRVADIPSEKYYTFPTKQKVKDKIAKDEYKNIELYGAYFMKRLNYLLELINPIPKQYENDFKSEDTDRTNFEIMMTYLINTVQINNIDLTLPLDKNGKFVALPGNESNKMFSIQPYNIKPNFRIPSISGGIKYFAKWMGLGGLFVIKYLSFIFKIPFRSLKILIQFILAEKFRDGKHTFDPRMINFIIWGIRHKIYQDKGKINKNPDDFFIGGLKNNYPKVEQLMFNIGKTGNIRQLQDGTLKLKRFFDNSEAFSSKSIIYYSVNILFDTLTDKDSKILKNAAKGATEATGATAKPIYNIETNKDSYPIEFAAKLLIYNLLKANKFEKEKEEEEKFWKKKENENDTAEPNLNFSSIINNPNNINETSGSIGYKNKLYEQVVETIIKLCGSSNNKEVLTSISKEFFGLLDKSSDTTVQKSIIDEVETSFSLAFGTYIKQFNLVGNSDQLSDGGQELLNELLNITDSSDLKNRFNVFNMDLKNINKKTIDYVSEIIKKELYKDKTYNSRLATENTKKVTSKKNINISNDKIEFPDSSTDFFEDKGFKFSELKPELKILFLNHTMFRFGLIKLNATLIAFVKNASKFEHMALKQNYILGIRNVDNKGLIQKVDDTIFKNELTDVELGIQQGTFNPFLYDNCYDLNEIALPNLIQYYKLYINNILERPTTKLTNTLNSSEGTPDRIKEIRNNYSKTSKNYQYTITKLLMFLKCNNLYNDYLLCYKKKIKESQDKFEKKIGYINSSNPKTKDESFNNAIKKIDSIEVKNIKKNINDINLLVSDPNIIINQSETLNEINNILDRYQVTTNNIYIVIDERIFNPFINKLYIKQINSPPGLFNFLINYSSLKYNKISKDYQKLKDLFDTLYTNKEHNIKSSGGSFLKNIINTLFLENNEQGEKYILNNINKLKNVLLRIKQTLGEGIKFVFNTENDGILNKLVEIIKETKENINFNLKDKHITSYIYDLLNIFDKNDTESNKLTKINISIQNKQFKTESNSFDEKSNKLNNSTGTCIESTLKYLNIDELILNENYKLTVPNENETYGHKETYENSLFENTNLEFKFLEQLNMVLNCWAKTGFTNKLQKNITNNNNKTNFDNKLKTLIVDECLKKQNNQIKFTTKVDWKKETIPTEFVFNPIVTTV